MSGTNSRTSTPDYLEHGLPTSIIHRRTREATISSLSSSLVKEEEQVTVVELDDRTSHDHGGNTLAERQGQSSSSSGSKLEDEDHDQEELTSFEMNLISRFNTFLPNLIQKNQFTSKVFKYLIGTQPKLIETNLKPILPRIENYFNKLFLPIKIRNFYLIPIFLLVWFLSFTFLVRASNFTASTSVGTPTFISGDESFWSKNTGCGLNGQYCTPFTNTSLTFRCPGQTLDLQLLNSSPVGNQLLDFQVLVVGGMDSLHTYRGDSWICAAAIQHGLFSNQKGGCGQLEQIGTFQQFVGGTKNGVRSVDFNSTFPSSYRFVEGLKQSNCKDLRNEILGFNVAMTVLFSFVMRPRADTFFWVLFIVGFWHVVLVSDPTSSPPNISLGFKYFLPALFVAYAFWRFSWRWVVPAFEGAILERTIWYLGGYWIGVLINISLSWIPITVLTPAAIAARPGSLIAVICVAVFLFLVILNQLREIRRTGWLGFYAKWYIVGTIVIGLLCAVPGQEFRMHHYIAGILLMPGCAFVTRSSALFQGFLLGIFLDGVGKWGFEAILQTSAALVGDGTLGSAIPSFLTNSTNFGINGTVGMGLGGNVTATVGGGMIYWNPIPKELVGQWDGFELIVDDVLRYVGLESVGLNYSLSGLDEGLNHYFRLGYTLAGSAGDFTNAATAYLKEGIWIDPVAGAT